MTDRLLGKTFELRNNEFPDEVVRLFEELNRSDEGAPWSRLVDGYLSHRVRFHLHLSIRDRCVESQLQEWCLACDFVGAVNGCGEVQNWATESPKADVWEVNDDAMKQDGVMFVFVGQFVEDGKRLAFGIAPSGVRLKRVNDCQWGSRDKPRPSLALALLGFGEASTEVLPLLNTNRELDLSLLALGGLGKVGAFLGDGPDDVVERTAEIVHDVPDHKWPVLRNFLGHFGPDTDNPGIAVYLHPRAYGFVAKKGIDFGIEGFEMFPCPV